VYVDYQVTRLIEDIWDIVPYVLEPIPEELIRYVNNELSETWERQCQRWLDRQSSDDNGAWNDYDAAVGWLGNRTLDTGYLSPNATIWFWRYGDVVTVAWNNREHRIESFPAWAAEQGDFALSVQKFDYELKSFRQRFLAAMRERVEAVCRSWSRPEVEIDLEQLVNKLERLRTLDQPTDWSSVIRAVEKIAGSV
jgi:hypothetical protein